MVSGITREDIRHARLHAKANESKQFLGFPILGFLKLIITQLDAGLIEWIGRVRFRERHGHVHVGRADIIRRIKDLFVEDRVDRVHDEVNLIFFREHLNVVLIAGIDELNREAFDIAELLLYLLGALHIEICEHHQFHPLARLGNGCNCLAHASDSDEQYFHEI